MNSIKNAIVTITLLVVGYGSYVILKEPARGPFVDQGMESVAMSDVDMTYQPSQGFTQPPIQTTQQPTLAPQTDRASNGSVTDNRFPQPKANPKSVLQTPNAQLKTKAESLADAVASRFDSFTKTTPPNNSSSQGSRFAASGLSAPTNISEAELSLPKVELENAAAGVASAFQNAKDSVTQQAKQTFGDKANVAAETIDQTINKAQNAFANQFENAKSKVNALAKSAEDFGTAARKELESKLPPLPKLMDAPSELKLPALKTDLAHSTAAEANPESLQFAAPKPEFRKLRPKDVAPEKTANELTISNIESTIPPPFANRSDVSPFDKSIRVDSAEDKMPTLPRVDEWEPYVGPPLSAADLEAGRKPQALDENATASANSLKVVEAGLVLPADTTTTTGEKLEPFAEPINPPVAAKLSEVKSFAPIANTNTAITGNGTMDAAPSRFEQTPQYPNTGELGPTQTQSVSFNQPDTTPSLIQEQARFAANPNPTFEKIWGEVQGHLKKQDYPRALRTLTPWSSESDLNQDQATRCILLLDQLAGAIIYSRQSYLEPGYQVKAGETLDEISAQYGVPKDLIAKINGVAAPYALMTGEKLKVVRGPFRATISLSRRELTLYVGPNYAGRFPVTIGSDMPPESAFYEVAEKLEGRTYFDRKLGREIIRSESTNRYGKHWLGLRGEHITTGHSVGIHGRPAKVTGDVGSISLESKDAADVFSILSIGSRVEVRP